MYLLEDRMYFDGAAAATVAAAAHENAKDASAAAPEHSDADDASAKAGQTSTPDAGSAAASQGKSGMANIDALIAAATGSGAAASGKELIAVSSALGNATQLEAAANAAGIATVEYNPQTESMPELLRSIETALNGEKAASIVFATTDNGASGFNLVSGEQIDAGAIQSQASFFSGLGQLIAQGGSISVSGDASLSSTDLGSLQSSIADAAGTSVSFIDASSGSVTSAKPASNSTDIYFVNPFIDDVDAILSGIPSDAKVVRLSAGGDGVQEISSYLSGKSDIDAIHLLTHGDARGFVLGNDIISSSTVGAYASQIASWGNALSADGDILVYSCSLAGGKDGASIVHEIAALTHADVAASTDSTGASGNWTLEYATGAIQAHAISAEGYAHDLSGMPCAVTDYVTTGSGDAAHQTLNYWIAQANANPDSSYTINFTTSVDQTITPTLIYDITTPSALAIENNSGHAITIKGSSVTNLFHVGSGANATLTNLTISEVCAGSAVVVESSASATINHCDFTGNVTSGGSGAAINSAGTVIVENGSSFSGNASTIGSGGAILNSGTMTISGATFDSNYTASNGCPGGVIYNSGTLTIENSTFNSNSSYYNSGGAILSSSGSVTVIGSAFTNNYAAQDGGAIASQDTAVTILNSSFSENTAHGNGGAICSSSGSLHIINSTFYENSSSQCGGAIYVGGGTADVSSCTIASNHAGEYFAGGGIYNAGTLALSNSIVIDNDRENSDSMFIAYDDIANAGSISSGGYNIVSATNCSCFLAASHDQTVSDSDFSNVLEWGESGPAFDSGSIAVAADGLAYQAIPLSAGSDSYNGTLSIDQRGRYLHDSTSSFNRDIGAVQSSADDNIPNTGDFISAYHASGNWSLPNSWMTYGSSGWVLASSSPATTSESHRVTVDTGSSIYTSGPIANLGFLVVAPGATLTLGGNLSIASTGTAKISSSISTGPYTLTLPSSGDLYLSGSGVSNLGNASSTSTFTNLTLDCASSTTISLLGDIIVENTLTLTSGYLSLGSHNLTIGESGSISGGGPNSFIITGGDGFVSKTFAAGAASSFRYEIGTMSGSTAQYSPITLSYAGGSVPVRVVNSAPSGVTSADRVNRYWVIGDPPDIGVDSAKFLPSDVSGNASSMQAQFSGDGGATWSSFGSVNAGANSFSGSLANFGIITAFGASGSNGGSSNGSPSSGTLNIDQLTQGSSSDGIGLITAAASVDFAKDNTSLAGFVTDGESGILLGASGGRAAPGSLVATMFGDVPNGERGQASSRFSFAGGDNRGISVVMHSQPASEASAGAEQDEELPWGIEADGNVTGMMDFVPRGSLSMLSSLNEKFTKHPSFMSKVDRMLCALNLA